MKRWNYIEPLSKVCFTNRDLQNMNYETERNDILFVIIVKFSDDLLHRARAALPFYFYTYTCMLPLYWFIPVL